MMNHDIKIKPEYFELVANGEKPWECRVNDRDYQTGDTVTMREWRCKDGYTGNIINATIGFIYFIAGNEPSGFAVFTLLDIVIECEEGE